MMQRSPESDAEELRKVYAEFSVKQLIDLLREPSDLRSGAETLIRAELDKRGVVLPRKEQCRSPEVSKPSLEIPTPPMTPADKRALRGGVLVCILNGLAILSVTFPIDDYLWGACLGKILSTLTIASLVTYLMAEVYRMLKARHESQGCPTEGWVFPTGSRSGHLEQGTAKKQYAKALADSEVAPFEPYCLRHTALTNLGDSGCDVFTLARIAGHSSIVITQRYLHPQADAVERAFAKMATGRKGVTDGGHLKNELGKGADEAAVNIEAKEVLEPAPGLEPGTY